MPRIVDGLIGQQLKVDGLRKYNGNLCKYQGQQNGGILLGKQSEKEREVDINWCAIWLSIVTATHNPTKANAVTQRCNAAKDGAAKEQRTQHNAQNTGYAYGHTVAKHNQCIGAGGDC